jgi:hypothetical protein
MDFVSPAATAKSIVLCSDPNPWSICLFLTFRRIFQPSSSELDMGLWGGAAHEGFYVKYIMTCGRVFTKCTDQMWVLLRENQGHWYSIGWTVWKIFRFADFGHFHLIRPPHNIVLYGSRLAHLGSASFFQPTNKTTAHGFANIDISITINQLIQQIF